MALRGIFIIGVALGAYVAPAAAQSCPSEYAACDNGGCCLSAEQCCPSLDDGCCSSATPYCCGDGTCAATPSDCELPGRAECDGYAVPCGGGCAPAGSDCCDLVGHYCPPESMCTSDTTCVRGDTPALASEVAVASQPDGTNGPATVEPPFKDPKDATDRSCSIVAPAFESTPEPWLWLIAAAALSIRRRSSAHREARTRRTGQRSEK
jgi:hypothetical protein